MENVIRVTDLKKNYGSKCAVDHLSFQVNKGEIFGLLGHNGAGKSTTIECVLGVKKFDKGSVEILGRNPQKNRKLVFEDVGVQLQHSNYNDKIKVWELCSETACLYKNENSYKALLKEFGLSEKSNQFVTSLSGGERQKLSILLTLIPNPKVIFLDELTTGLDTAARREVWKHLINLKEKGITIFLTSHYMDEVEALCSRILIIKDGREIVTGTVNDVINKSPYERLEEAYLWYMGEEI